MDNLVACEKHFIALNTQERFCCGPTYFGPPPLCARARVDYVCAPQALQLQVRDVRVFRSWGSKLRLVAAPGHREHLPLGVELDIALPFHQIPVAPVPRWDKKKLAGLVLRGQGRARSLEDVQKELDGLFVGFKFSPHRNTGTNCRVQFVVQDSLFCK